MYLNPCVVLRGIVRDAKHTYTHPPERVILIACLAFTAIGSRQIVAQLALSALMEIVLALVHIYKTHNGKDMGGGSIKRGMTVSIREFYLIVLIFNHLLRS